MINHYMLFSAEVWIKSGVTLIMLKASYWPIILHLAMLLHCGFYHIYSTLAYKQSFLCFECLLFAFSLSLQGKPGSPANVPSAELVAATPPGGPHLNIMLHLTLLLHLLVLSPAGQ